MSVAAWLGPEGLFARNAAGFVPREAQLAMGLAVERALSAEQTLLIEAGTGTGKTLAYLVPAILSGKKIVISTGTKTLQDQIVQRDLPLIERQLGKPIAAVCMKGLSNYLCLRRYEEFRRGPEAAFGPHAKQLPLLERWRETTATGDRAELTEFALDAPLWHEVQSSSETRIGPKCAHFAPCFVTKMRKEAETARILIVNHHLYFADLAMRGPHSGGVIPDHDAVIFDEAHGIEDVATEFFGVSVSTSKIELLLRDAQRAFVAAGLFARSERLTSAVALTAAHFFETLPRAKTGESGRVPLLPETFLVRLQEPMFALDNALDALSSFAALAQSESEAIAQIARRADQIRNEVASIADGGQGGQVTWTLARGRSVSIGSSPVEIANVLRDKLFMRSGACVLTSATLSTGNSFEYVKARLGIDFDIEETSLASPFDYPQQAALYLPRGLGD
ncbi:MAG TPA: ATP-dependent DNA helicase, partial [Polyangiales bacterium]